LENGEILYQHNADKMFIPASNQKILTSAAALLTLEPDFRYETKLYYSGEIVDSVLIGDLIIQGNGDPTFSSEFYDDPRIPFYCWADTLHRMGIRKITGNIIGEDNAFDDIGLGKGWMVDDLNYTYAAESGALQFNDNSIMLNIIPPADHEKSVHIIPEMKSSYFSILDEINIIKEGKTNINIDRPINSNEITLSGSISISSRMKSQAISLTNPTLYFVTFFKEILMERGISLNGKALDCDDIDDWKFDIENISLILVHASPPLSKILQIMMEESNNLYAETLVKTLGWQQGEIGSFEEGKRVIQLTLNDLGLKAESYAFQDGSGLSRYNLISPRQIVQVLKSMLNTDRADLWRDIMPIEGIYEHTLTNRIIRTTEQGNMKAKTGTMSNVRCLSGYIIIPEGDIVFSVLVNGHLLKSKEIDIVTDNVLNFLMQNLIK